MNFDRHDHFGPHDERGHVGSGVSVAVNGSGVAGVSFSANGVQVSMGGIVPASVIPLGQGRAGENYPIGDVPETPAPVPAFLSRLFSGGDSPSAAPKPAMAAPATLAPVETRTIPPATPAHSESRPVPPASSIAEPSTPAASSTLELRADGTAKITEIATADGHKIKTETVQRALAAAGGNLGPFANNGIDNDAGNATFAALDNVRKKLHMQNVGSHTLSAEDIAVLSDEKKLAELRAASAHEHTAPASVQARHDRHDHPKPASAVAPAVETPQAPTAMKIDDGHGHMVTVAAELQAKGIKPEVLALVERQTGGEEKNGAVLNEAGFNARVADIAKQFHDKSMHIRGNTNPDVSLMALSLENIARRHPAETDKPKPLSTPPKDITVATGYTLGSD